MLINGACLLTAWRLAPLVSAADPLPVGGMVLALAILASMRTLTPEASAGFGRYAWLYLRSQLAVAAVCVAAGRLVWDWPWSGFVFLPVWTGLTWLALLRHMPPHLRRNPLASFPGADTALTGALLAGVTAFFFGGLAFHQGAAWAEILGPAVGWFVVDRLPFARWQDAAHGRSRLTRFAIRLTIWAVTTGGLLIHLGGEPVRTHAALVFVTTLALALFGLSHRHRLVAGSENAARTLFALTVAALIHPFACHRMLGSQDAQWYMNTLADFIAQIRAGVFPVFAGQSEHLFNGGVLPIRFAPLFQHYGLLLDSLTLHTLRVDALQNGVIAASFAGAAITSWAVLSRLLPGRPWVTAGLSALFLSCPGVLSIVYYDDLLMTWTTLPWLPLVFGGCMLGFRSREPWPLLLAGTSLGLVWWGHSPVAMWTTLAVTAIQAARLAVTPPREWPWRSLLAGGGACLAIALYPLVSVLAVPVQTGTMSAESIDPELIIRITHFIQQSFPGILVPMFAKSHSVSDYQAGWALLITLGLCAGATIVRRVKSPVPWALLAVPAVLQLLLLPIPGMTGAVWSMLPAALVNPTGIWPMQRLYVIMAASIVCAAAALLHDDSAGRRPLPIWLSCLLAAGVAWSAAAAVPIMEAKTGQRRALALATDWTLPENHVLTRYSYLFFGRQPGYYSHGHVDPLYEQRFLAPDDRRQIGGNPQAILAAATAGRVLGEGPLTAGILHAGGAWQITPRFMLEPHKRYVLELRFAHATAPGVLLVTGGHLQRNYALPRYGEKFAFGSGPDASPLLPLQTTGNQPLEVTLQFAPQPADNPTDLSRFGTYRWIEIDPAALPVRVTGWIPYRAEVNAPADVWLETPRMFQPGYRATVNGNTVAVEKSPEGLVAVPVPAGPSTVVVAYHPPLILQLAYWISLAAMLVCVGVFLRRNRSQAGTV